MVLPAESGRIRIPTYTNEVWASKDTIEKIYRPSEFSPATPLVRLRREANALRFYRSKYPDDIFTPALIDVDEAALRLVQERIVGESLQEKALRGENHQYLAGQLLRRIHTPLNRSNSLLREDFERQVRRVSSFPHMRELLALGGIERFDFNVDWDEVYRLGSTRIHRDYWLPHIIIRDEDQRPFVVDWDFYRPGSPFQEFITVKEWIIEPFGHGKEFWAGYGFKPHEATMNEYIKLQCLRYLIHIKPDLFLEEPVNGLYHRQMAKLKELTSV